MCVDFRGKTKTTNMLNNMGITPKTRLVSVCACDRSHALTLNENPFRFILLFVYSREGKNSSGILKTKHATLFVCLFVCVRML